MTPYHAACRVDFALNGRPSKRMEVILDLPRDDQDRAFDLRTAICDDRHDVGLACASPGALAGMGKVALDRRGDGEHAERGDGVQSNRGQGYRRAKS